MTENSSKLSDGANLSLGLQLSAVLPVGQETLLSSCIFLWGYLEATEVQSSLHPGNANVFRTISEAADKGMA